MVAALVCSELSAAPLRADQVAFVNLYRELVETDTTLSSGSCTLAAERMAARLKNAGFSERDVKIVVAPDHPREGNLVVVLPGAKPEVKAMLLLAHIDVVEARREDWSRDPFTLTEEVGFYYGRGVADDKAMAAIWIDSLIRMKREGYRPLRTIKVALTCGEETTDGFNGADYLARNHIDLIDAEFALNEGGGGRLSPDGQRQILSLQIGEKAVQNFSLVATGPGGHSSRPVSPNAIAQLAAAIGKIDAHVFPVRLNPVTRTFFRKMAAVTGGERGAAMLALVARPEDNAAAAVVSQDPMWRAMLRTTCVTTLVEGGHASNALPQLAQATINCRLLPGESVEGIRQALISIIGDPAVAVRLVPPVRPTPGSPPQSRKIADPVERLAARFFPGVPVVPMMSTGGTDGIFMLARGIPTYGVPGLFFEHDMNGIHGANERLRVRSLFEGREYLDGLVRDIAGQP